MPAFVHTENWPRSSWAKTEMMVTMAWTIAPTQLAARIGGNALAQRTELEAARLDVIEEFEQIAHAAPESIQRPDHDPVHPAETVQHLDRLGTAGLGPADPVVTVNAFTTHGFQLPDLQFGALVGGAGTATTQTCHLSFPGTPSKAVTL